MWCNIFKEFFILLIIECWFLKCWRSSFHIITHQIYIPNPRFFLSEKWSSKPKKKALYDLEVGRPSSSQNGTSFAHKKRLPSLRIYNIIFICFSSEHRNRKCNTHNVFLLFCEYMKPRVVLNCASKNEDSFKILL